MDAEETLTERQENEVQVLESIYQGDVEDVRKKDTWKVERPPEVLITLTPQQSTSMLGGDIDGKEKCLPCVTLHIKCPSDYPMIVPEIKLESEKGLTEKELKELELELQALANHLVGEVMVLDLCQHVQKFLHAHRREPAKSFYEEMLSQQKKEAEAKVRQQQHDLHQLQIQRQHVHEEMQRKQEALREEEMRRRQSLNRDSSTFRSIDREAIWKEEGNQEILTLNGSIKRVIQKGAPLGKSGVTSGESFFAFDVQERNLLILKEWHCPKQQDFPQWLLNLEEESEEWLELEHENLVRLVTIGHFIGPHPSTLTVFIIQDYIPGIPLSYHLHPHCYADQLSLKHYARGMLSCLEFLHGRNLIHGCLRPSSVFLNHQGKVKVGATCLEKKIGVQLQGFQDPFSFASPNTKMGDIQRVAYILLSLKRGFLIKEPNPHFHASFSPQFQHFLSRCAEGAGASELLRHPILTRKEDEDYLQEDGDFFHHPEAIHAEARDKVAMMVVNEGEERKQLGDKGLGQIPIFLPSLIKRNSRLLQEFYDLEWLGSGGFGDVLKGKNKLDGNIYAIKRVVLNPRNRALNRKITREVKLLSRLNHENVVRYFNSWIETTTIETEESGSSPSEDLERKQTETSSSQSNDFDKKVEGGDSELLRLGSALPPPNECSVEWSTSYPATCAGVDGNESSSSEDEEEEGCFGTSCMFHAESKEDSFEGDSVVFENESIKADEKQESIVEAHRDENQQFPTIGKIYQYLYIQMEFCEKSTLLTAIQNGLHGDEDRIWQLFREIVEGLAHIHQQGMIHRDLKPTNIFLDSEDHVKIGDFGLATADGLHRHQGEEQERQSNRQGEDVTGCVGTAFYVAPELLVTPKTPVYSQVKSPQLKVDMYSLGVILFEMLMKPARTAMERAETLFCLCSPQIVLPTDFPKEKEPLIRSLLHHDPGSRPSSSQLLNSNLLPPPKDEENRLYALVRRSLENPQSKAYKFIVAACMDQVMKVAENVTYDMDIPRGPISYCGTFLQEKALEKLKAVFRRHGAIPLRTPLLMPKTSQSTETHVDLMDHGGSMVCLPHDLRVPFIRYVARHGPSMPTPFKRYSFSRVFRKRRVFGLHPRELLECALDIVTTSSGKGGELPDAEVLCILEEILSEFHALSERGFQIHLNHIDLVKGLLFHVEIPENLHQKVLIALEQWKGDWRPEELQAVGVSSEALNSLYSFIRIDCLPEKIEKVLRPVIEKRKSPAGRMTRETLAQLNHIISICTAMKLNVPVVITPWMLHKVDIYSGIMFQLVAPSKKKKRLSLEILAAGGRYDSMLAKARSELGPSILLQVMDCKVY
ncbi:unnamed protein product [Darwinula stevensoni]|uniref:non-specific serine/threonine protein kinase n=1 Tax=Darwinula stevensoni TaxID=69355 RepID=A0A7R9A288_9CRUS|nr:unnamed protein product [Darwinula stevensoni]CAG0879388.1 unnamed protein product [Darwinula stevensoni]